MIIKKLSVYNFKNHSEKKFEFSPQINCFVGNNGVGKTNILDALHYLSVGKSFLGNTDLNNIKSEEDFSPLMLRSATMTVMTSSESPNPGKPKGNQKE